jgi:hypothetical protein
MRLPDARHLPLALLCVTAVAARIFVGPHIVDDAYMAVVGYLVMARGREAFWRVWSVWAGSYLISMTAANGFTHFPWYFVPLLPIYLAAAAAGFEGIASRALTLPRMMGAPAIRAATAAVIAAVLLSRMPALRNQLDANAAGREKLYASIAVELARNDARCTVAATEIGTIGYYYPGRVLDLVGLVSPEVLGRPVDAVLAESHARWVVTYDSHFDRAVASSERFSTLFERRSSIPVSDTRSLEVYERRHRPDCTIQ